MKVIKTEIPEVLILEPRVHEDERGFFFESFNQRVFEEITGMQPRFVQDNHSHSVRNVLRGLHYQSKQPQGKLVRVVAGEVFDVAVDLRKYSSTFGKWCGTILSESNKRMVWIPEGFAHGFLVLSGSVDFLYKTTDFYAPQDECCLLWNDPDLGITWPLKDTPLLSAKDQRGVPFRKTPVFCNNR